MHGRFGGEGLVFLGNQDLAPYPTREAGGLDHDGGEVRVMRTAEIILVVTETGCQPDIGSGEHGKAG